MKYKALQKTGLFLAALALCITFTACGWEPDNIPYEPDTPAPAPHSGLFVSDHGTMTFSGNGKSVVIDFDEELSGLMGLPEGEQEGTYVFLSGDLPPHGSMPIRYDAAHELQLSIGGRSARITLGTAVQDGKTASSGVGTVTSTRIPMLFFGDSFSSIVFRKQIRYLVDHFFFTESNGSDPDSRTLYELGKENGVYTATVKPEGVKDEDALITETSEDFAEKLEEILTAHKIERWNGYDESEDVLDGIGFVFRVILTDETKIEASGYMKWPQGYNLFAADIHHLFLGLYEENQ